MFRFNSRPTEARAAHGDAPAQSATPPTHDPTLIPRLVADHAQLKDLLERLEDLAIHRQYAMIRDTLLQFRDALLRHIEEEEAHLYTPVLHALHDDEPARTRLARAHARMAGIARLAAPVVKHYDGPEGTAATRAAFLRDLDVVASLLGDRIELEKMSLYALYAPTAAPDAERLCAVG